jgi:hypothetical protein
MRRFPLGGLSMTVDRFFRGIVGILILSSLGLARYHHQNWLYFNGLVGVMLLQSSLTDRCPLLWLLEKTRLRRCRA